ncbi:MAG: pyruvate kinase, partial [Acidobacteria bacterium]|nr:pyruvate kinase [Acidobacteriota bacterium]
MEVERRRATKIVATIGRNAENEGHLDSLLAAGVDVVRINGAHCRPGDIAAKVALVRAAEARAGRPVGILLDLGGPKIRVGPMPGGAIEYPPGTLLEIVPGSAPGTDKRLSVTYGALLDDVAPGAEIRMDDGRVCLKVERREKHALFARLAAGGRIKTGAGVNFPLSSLSAPALTSKDKRDLAEGLEAGIDFVGLSFVRSAAHVQSLRRLLDRMPEELRPWIVAKIERSEALQDLHAIARATDILMVARGDLGVEIGLASVPRAQREILHVGRTLAVPVIVATQMLETMIENPFPTRAEVTDVAVAVHDGADAVMLSGETAVGKYPVEAVTVMAEIAKKAEMPESGFAPAASRNMGKADFAAVITSLLSELVPLTEAKAVVVYTEFGRTARLVSKEQLFVPIYAFSP